MVLDEVTLRNLELLRNIRDRSKRGTLLEFLDRTQTPMGSRSLARWIQMPVLSKEEIERRLDAVEELKESPVLQEYLVQAFSGTST
jgi:DNA mismatch repair protein MutS